MESWPPKHLATLCLHKSAPSQCFTSIGPHTLVGLFGHVYSFMELMRFYIFHFFLLEIMVVWSEQLWAHFCVDLFSVVFRKHVVAMFVCEALPDCIYTAEARLYIPRVWSVRFHILANIYCSYSFSRDILLIVIWSQWQSHLLMPMLMCRWITLIDLINHIDGLKQKAHAIISTDAENAFGKNPKCSPWWSVLLGCKEKEKIIIQAIQLWTFSYYIAASNKF